MEQGEIFLKVAGIFEKVLKRKVKLEPTSTANDVSGWDSLHHIQIIDETEKMFNIEFSLEEIVDMISVEDICNAVKQKLDGK